MILLAVLLAANAAAQPSTAAIAVPSSRSAAQRRTPPLTGARCERLSSLAIPAASIGLATKGGTTTSARFVPADTAAADPHPDHCLVSGRIAPVDASAPDIRFEVALPAAWNGKAVMLGGGGFNGSIPKIASNASMLAGPAPLARGFVVFGGDSGHQSAPGNLATVGRFAMNDEAYRNYSGEALKKTRDAALVVIRAAYGQAPRTAYFIGGSKGGGEGLYLASRWGADWDGIVSHFPAHGVGILLGMLTLTENFGSPATYPSVAKRMLLHRAAMAACDGLDGVADGLIGNVGACRKTFDPATATVDGTPLRCSGGADAGDTCLSDAQLAAFKAADGETRYGFTLADGHASFPGFNMLTSVSGVAPTTPVQATVTIGGLGYERPAFPVTPKMPLTAMFVDNYFRYFVTRDTGFDASQVSFATLKRYEARLKQLSAPDPADAALGAFQKRGGKLILMHGSDDLLISPRWTESYYASLRSSLGARKVDSFVRFYEVAGMGHGASATFQASWDYLGAIGNWAERGVDPADALVVADLVGVPGRTRPMCRFPAFPRYRGTGDVNAAASFACARR